MSEPSIAASDEHLASDHANREYRRSRLSGIATDSRRIGNRTMKMLGPLVVAVYEQIVAWQAENPTKSMDDAMNEFCGLRNGHALCRMVYSDPHPDITVKFNNTEAKHNSVREEFERVVLENRLLLESVHFGKYTYLKVFAPFETLAREAKLQHLKLPLLVSVHYVKALRIAGLAR